MCELYIVGMGRGDRPSLQVLEQERFSAVRHCLLYGATEMVKDYLRERGWEISNLEEFQAQKANKSLWELEKEVAGNIPEFLKEKGSALLLLPGRPWPGMSLLKHIRSMALSSAGFQVEIVAGEDLWGPVMDCLAGKEIQADLSRGTILLDAASLEMLRQPSPGELLIGHIWGGFMLAPLVKRLLRFFPAEHKVHLLFFQEEGCLGKPYQCALGSLESIEKVPHGWCFLRVPPSRGYLLGDMLHMMEELRSPGGCPWDRQQDHFSLRPYLLEETYEVLSAINEGNPQELCEELGDLLLQIVFHSQLAVERNDFSLWQVIDGITAKIYRRHPHVFQQESADTPGEVSRRWQEIKSKEKGKESRPHLEVPDEFPALMKAQKIQKKAADLGFDWPEIEGALQKVPEELEELHAAFLSGNREKVEEELGDLFFSLVNVARFLGVDSESALEKTVEKFRRRFRYIEKQVQGSGKDYAAFTLDELDRWWKEAKECEKEGKGSFQDEKDS